MRYDLRHTDAEPALHLTLIRHGRTPWNEQRRYQGWGDPGLSEHGRRAAARVRERLAGECFDRVVTSDLARARETAAIALPEAEPVTDRRLRELNFGALEGLTYDECHTRFGDPFLAWIREPELHDPPEGESLAAFRARVTEALSDLPGDGRVALVAHSGTIRMILAEALSITFGTSARMRISACGISRLERRSSSGWTVTSVNDTGHLHGL